MADTDDGNIYTVSFSVELEDATPEGAAQTFWSVLEEYTGDRESGLTHPVVVVRDTAGHETVVDLESWLRPAKVAANG